jgi:MFS family permease
MNLIPLFLVSMAAVGYETALTRYFAVAKWSEYGYWVISIVMVGFALSGVVLALFRDAFARNGQPILAVLPPLLVVTAALGFMATTANPFNPLQLQNLATWQPQIWNIAGYYAALLPFFFLAGIFISLTFVMNTKRIGIVYGYDLTGAGAGAALILAAMFIVHPFDLVPLLLVPLAFAAAFIDSPWRWKSAGAAVLALVAAEAVLLLNDPPAYNDFKAIYAPLHTPDGRQIAEIRSPRGEYALLDDFTERVDTDVSNNAGELGLPGPPQTFGLYRDGNRIAGLPMRGTLDVRYAPATLDALPYHLIPHARVLLAGGNGGYKVAEAKALGAIKIRVLEPEPVLAEAMQDGLGPSPARPLDPAVRIGHEIPLIAARQGVYDIVDISAGFVDTAEINASAFSAEAIGIYLRRLAPGGIVSLPVSIRDFPVYALRVLATVRAALLQSGIQDPAAHVVVYRSAWSVRILLSRDGWSEEALASIRKFCDQRSFDVSWFPGMDVVQARSSIYNDLPAVSFDKGEVTSTGLNDAIADEAQAVLDGKPTPSAQSFNLSPITLDRPFFYAALRLGQLGTVLKRLEILPQAEVGALVNLAVLAQAVVIAALVLMVPLFARRRLRGGGASAWRAVIYFPALGLGFLFIEIFLIEKASFWLNDRTSGFAVVLTAMLVFSGLGSLSAARFDHCARRGAAVACGVVAACSVMMMLALEPMILNTIALPWLARVSLLIVLIAPISVALGLPFPLALSRMGEDGFLPWAWGLNGAFSVVATPLANLIAREAGYGWVLLCAAILYGVALLAFPAMRNRPAWHAIPAPSRAAE